MERRTKVLLKNAVGQDTGACSSRAEEKNLVNEGQVHSHVNTLRLTHARVHVNTHAHTSSQTSARAHTHTHTHTLPGSNPVCAGIFPGRVIPVTSKVALQWLSCQAPGVIGSALGLVGPVSVYCDWVRWKVRSATSISAWQHVQLSE